MTALEEALEAKVRAIVADTVVPPTFVNQRTVAAVVGLPHRDFLRLARAGGFPSTRERRLVIARTSDVVAYVERQIALREAKPGNDHDAEAVALARVGARRVSR